ncbi:MULTISPECIES: hypothetical protein [unclassified Moorena]|nr:MULTISPECIES: hypothetical protein [unclassified Moorena]NEQ57073.1 hypothetical protein [Moorena sp. SIO4A1]
MGLTVREALGFARKVTLRDRISLGLNSQLIINSQFTDLGLWPVVKLVVS